MVDPRALLRLDRQGGDGALPLHEQVYRQLRTRIESGTLTGGTRLPAARVVAAELGVARNTVDAALLRLQQDGLVVRRAGAGSVVADGVALVRAAPETRFVRVHAGDGVLLKVYAIATPSDHPLDGLVDAALAAVLDMAAAGAASAAPKSNATARCGTLIVQARHDRHLALLDLWQDDGLLEHGVWSAEADTLALFSRITGGATPLSPEALAILAHESSAWHRLGGTRRDAPALLDWQSDVAKC